MSLRAILVLLVLVAGLGAVLWWTDAKPEVAKVAETSVLQGRTLRECTSMRWQLQDRVPVEVAMGPDNRFWLKEPIQDLASEAHLRQIALAWETAQMRATPLADDDSGRQKAGLVPPELVFTVTFPGAQPLTVEVGAPGPLGTTRFLRVHGKIWEGSEALLESMRVGLDDLRERTVFRNAAAQITELRVEQRLPTGKSETIHVRQEGDGWRLLAPRAGRADPAATARFVTAVLSLRVDYFTSGSVKMPEGPPRLRIRVKGAHGEETLDLWDENFEMYGKLPGRTGWFQSSSNQYAQIFQNAVEAMRARILVPMGESGYSDLVELITDPGQGFGDRMRLTRETPAADWFLVEPVAYAAAVTPCAEAVDALQRLVAMEFVDDADAKRPLAEDPRYGLQPGVRFAVTTRLANNKTGTTLWLGGETQRGEVACVYACRSDEPDTVALVPKAMVTTLRRPWTEYCSLRVYRELAAVGRLQLTRADGQQRAFGLKDGTWRLSGADAARNEVGELVRDELVDLVGARAVDARAATFDRPEWTLTFQRENGDALGTLRFWDRGEAGLLVQQGERGPVALEIKPRLARDLRALWQ